MFQAFALLLDGFNQIAGGIGQGVVTAGFLITGYQHLVAGI